MGMQEKFQAPVEAPKYRFNIDNYPKSSNDKQLYMRKVRSLANKGSLKLSQVKQIFANLYGGTTRNFRKRQMMYKHLMEKLNNKIVPLKTFRGTPKQNNDLIAMCMEDKIEPIVIPGKLVIEKLKTVKETSQFLARQRREMLKLQMEKSQRLTTFLDKKGKPETMVVPNKGDKPWPKEVITAINVFEQIANSHGYLPGMRVTKDLFVEGRSKRQMHLNVAELQRVLEQMYSGYVTIGEKGKAAVVARQLEKFRVSGKYMSALIMNRYPLNYGGKPTPAKKPRKRPAKPAPKPRRAPLIARKEKSRVRVVGRLEKVERLKTPQEIAGEEEKRKIAESQKLTNFPGQTEAIPQKGNKPWPVPVIKALNAVEKILSDHGYGPGLDATKGMYIRGEKGKYHVNVEAVIDTLASMMEMYAIHSLKEKASTIIAINKQLASIYVHHYPTLLKYNYPTNYNKIRSKIRRRPKIRQEDRNLYNSYLAWSRPDKLKRKGLLKAALNPDTNEYFKHMVSVAFMRGMCLKKPDSYYRDKITLPEGAKVFNPDIAYFGNARLGDLNLISDKSPKYVVPRWKMKRLIRKARKAGKKLVLTAKDFVKVTRVGTDRYKDSRGKVMKIYKGYIISDTLPAAGGKPPKKPSGPVRVATKGRGRR